MYIYFYVEIYSIFSLMISILFLVYIESLVISPFFWPFFLTVWFPSFLLSFVLCIFFYSLYIDTYSIHNHNCPSLEFTPPVHVRKFFVWLLFYLNYWRNRNISLFENVCTWSFVHVLLNDSRQPLSFFFWFVVLFFWPRFFIGHNRTLPRCRREDVTTTSHSIMLVTSC